MTDIMRKTTKILSQIKLKYFSNDNNDKKSFDPDFICDQCSKTGGKKGAIKNAYSNNPFTICEDCAIDNFMKEENCASREVASARRRRIFDINYLFNEMIIDDYLRKLGYSDFDDLTDEEYEKAFSLFGEWYNILFSHQKKLKMEEMDNQEDIEVELRKSLDKHIDEILSQAE